MQKSTLKKLSQSLGISISTVSRALKDHPDISVIGHITAKEQGALLVTKSSNLHPITAQGWNAFRAN